MLDFSFYHDWELKQLQKEVVTKEKYKYLNPNCYSPFTMPVISDSTWDCIDKVSFHNGKVIGRFKADITRSTSMVDSLMIVNFSDNKVVFGRDLKQFITDLFLRFNMRKIEWSVIVGSPQEKMYDKFCGKYGGRIVGVFKKTCVMVNGDVVDLKWYEIFKEDLLARIKSKTLKKLMCVVY